MNKKIIAFAGSNSLKSINKKLVKFALCYFKDNEHNILDLNDFEMKIYSIDREEKGFPKKAYLFREQIKNADLIICSLAENNGSYSVAFKNIFDWCSRIERNVFQKKPMLLLSTSPGNFGGSNVMNAAKNYFPFCGANIVETFSLPNFYDNFDEQKGIINPELLIEFERKIETYMKHLED